MERWELVGSMRRRYDPVTREEIIAERGQWVGGHYRVTGYVTVADWLAEGDALRAKAVAS